MPVSQTLLDLLACPENHTALHHADEGTLGALNRSIAEGTLHTRGGRRVTEPLSEGLVRADGTILYPVVDGIPVMMIDEGIMLPSSPATHS